ncbi:MAG: hypothetical protein HY720_29760 [Planctomycetes bacterium]|nr:hypothetical protein [Planctomycetota bacterium]
MDMPIKFACSCGKHLVAPESKMGQSIRCPQCGEVLVVPGASYPTVVQAPPKSGPTDRDHGEIQELVARSRLDPEVARRTTGAFRRIAEAAWEMKKR